MKIDKKYIGRRIVVTNAGMNSIFYSDGSSGIIKDVDSDGDLVVVFDRGEYSTSAGSSTWFVGPEDVQLVEEC